jgi:undecaprenyl-diphosphatase
MPAWTDRRLLSVLAVLIALWLAMLLLGGPDSGADAALLRVAHLPALVPAARVASTLGGWSVFFPATLFAAVAIALRGAPRNAALLGVLMVAGRLSIELQKAGFDRVRPDPHGRLVAVHNMAFPSGHAGNSMIALLGFALVAFGGGRLRGPAVLLALLLTGLVGISRLVLAVHWPSDVIGGWAFGAALTLGLLRIGRAGDTPIAERQGASFIDPGKERIMIEGKDRPDDSALIDEMEEAPGQGGSSGGNLQRDVASQAEQEHEIGGASGVTRVTGEDKPADGDERTLPRRD